MISTIAGVPAHPLFVHLAVISAPVAVIVAIVLAFAPRLWPRLGTAAVGLSALAAAALLITASAGEALLPSEGLSEEHLGRMAEHAFLGDVSKILALTLFLAIAAQWWLERRAAKRLGRGAGAGKATRTGESASAGE